MTRGAAAPQISVLLGTSAGGAAYGEALTHLAVQIPTGRGLEEGLQAGYVNRVIAPEITAVAIFEELERAASGRGRHGNTPL